MEKEIRPTDDIEIYHSFTDDNKLIVSEKFDPTKRITYDILRNYDKQDKALLFSIKNGVIPAFAFDFEFQDFRVKKYLVTGYQKFWQHLKKLDKNKRIYYELCIQNVPSHFHVDAEIDLTRNSNVNIKEIQKDFIRYTKELMIELKYTDDVNNIKVFITDSTSFEKISRHYIFKINKKMFMSNIQCGAFMRRLRNKIQEEEGIDPQKNRFFFKRHCTDENHANNPEFSLIFFADLGIYTKHRVYRTLGSTKNKQNRHFIAMDENDTIIGDLDSLSYKDFVQYFIQYDATFSDIELLVCTDPDGKETTSSSNLRSFRLDLKSTKVDSFISNQQLLDYYSNQYPFDFIWKLFGDEDREFGFFLEDSRDHHQYMIRNKTFKTVQDFKNYVLNTVPLLIHIGPVYDSLPNKTVKYRELVFDIDLNDYTNDKGISLRSCCGKEKKCCYKCWKIALVAKIVIQEAFHKYYSFDDIKFFFSGGKGLHCFIMDQQAKTLTSKKRTEILQWFETTRNLTNLPIFKYIKSKVPLSLLSEIAKEQNINQIKKTELLKIFWPKFDTMVTTSLTHLLKSPFCIHSQTQNIAIEITNAEFPGK